MLKTIEFDATWIHKVDEETSFSCRPFGGALTSNELDKAYFTKCVFEATGFEYKGKGVKVWKKKTGVAKYANGKEAHVGDIPFHRILPATVATELLADIMKHSLMEDGERKN